MNGLGNITWASEKIFLETDSPHLSDGSRDKWVLGEKNKKIEVKYDENALIQLKGSRQNRKKKSVIIITLWV